MKNKYWLLIILFLAAFFRLYQLDQIPPGLYPDEAINGMNALESPGQIFYPDNNGREGLFINLIALSLRIFGPQIWALRIVSALIGILTVLGLYLLTKELFNRRIALLSSFLLSISFWHINFSRISFRAILVPFILCFSFYFLFRALRTEKLSDFIFSGIFFGLGFYTYIAFRAAILILLFIIILKLRRGLAAKKSVRTPTLPSPSPTLCVGAPRPSGHGPAACPRGAKAEHRAASATLGRTTASFCGRFPERVLIWYFLVIILIVLPLGIYFLQNPQFFISRAGGVSVFATENPLKAIGTSTIKHLAMFNIAGDWNWRHNYSSSPMLLWPVGILFVIGLVFSIWKVIKLKAQSSKLKTTTKNLKLNYIFLIAWFVIMLVPAILTYEGIPHALRAIGVIPVVYIFAGLGLNKLKLPLPILLIFLMVIIGVQFQKYFLDWGTRQEVKNAFSQELVDVGNKLIDCDDCYVKMNLAGVLVDGIPMPSQTIKFVTYQKANIKYVQELPLQDSCWSFTCCDVCFGPDEFTK